MTLFTRYIAARFLRHLLGTVATLLALVLVAQLIGQIDRVIAGPAGLLGFLQDTAETLPRLVERMLPIAVLLAAMFAFNGLGRTTELTAMKTAGLGPARMVWPVLLVLVPVAAVAYLNQNYLHPRLNPGSVRLTEGDSARQRWRSLGDQVYHFSRIDPAGRRVGGVRAFQWSESRFRMSAFEHIGQGLRGPEQWVLRDIERRWRDGQRWRVERVPRREVPPAAFPDVLRPARLNAHHVPFLELYRELRRLEPSDPRVANYLLEWYQKPAALCALAVMALIGIAFSQAASRRGRGGAEVVATILVGVMFWLLTEIFLMLGKGDYLPPLMATWTPNAVFLTLSLLHIWRTP